MVDLLDVHPARMTLADPKDLHEVTLQLAGDPYFPEGAPVTLVDLSKEEDPSKEEEHDPKEVEESNDEGILQDVEEIDDDDPIEDKESLNGEEPTPSTPPYSPSRPYYHPYHHNCKGPFLMRTPRIGISPVYHLDPSTHVS